MKHKQNIKKLKNEQEENVTIPSKMNDVFGDFEDAGSLSSKEEEEEDVHDEDVNDEDVNDEAVSVDGKKVEKEDLEVKAEVTLKACR